MPVQRVLVVSPEYYGYYHAGGLGAAVHGLVNALAERGLDVTVALPNYFRKEGLESNKPNIYFALMPDRSNGYESFFGYKGYTGHDGEAYRTELLNLATTASQFASEVGKYIKSLPSDKAPQVVHVHDWHSSFLPFLLSASVPTLLTVHNAIYTCPFPPSNEQYDGIPSVQAIALDGRVYRTVLEFGIDMATRVNTVSQTYAQELLKGQHISRSLHEAIKRKGLVGIVNGIDHGLFNPARDSHIVPFNTTDQYSLNRGKAMNKVRLQEYYFGKEFIGDEILFVSMMGRPVKEKGIELVLDAASEINKIEGLQLLIVGDALNNSRIAERMRQLQKNIRGSPNFVGPEMQHRVLAGSDAILMPSSPTEPCGQVQLEGMRYGAIPIVTHVGGLRDTVKPVGEDGGYGIVIDEESPDGIVRALRTSVELFRNSARWTELEIAAAGQDFSWTGPRDSVGKYIALYEKLIKQSKRV